MNRRLIIKVCGLREAENIRDISLLNPDMIGFIFYNKSPRYVEEILNRELLINLPENIIKVGVFVNNEVDEINIICDKYSLDVVQLHGNESPEFCEKLSRKRKIIKAFAIDNSFDPQQCDDYQAYCSYFLFDTKGKSFGGNSEKFNWEVLKKYSGEKEFILSGG
ncbi:phosphoribosylanthranilate isomerase, partial [Bacteroidota bacterium]